MKCLRCGEFNADDSIICWNCKAVLKGLAGDHTEGSAVSVMLSPGDENSRYQKGAVNRKRQSVRSDWKFSLLPILALIALLAILVGNILQEAATAKMSDADTFQDLVEASKDLEAIGRIIQIGTILLAFVVTGISIEYRRQ